MKEMDETFLFSSALDNCSDFIIYLKSDKIHWTNAAARRLLRCAPDAPVEGISFDSLLAPEYRGISDLILQEATKSDAEIPLKMAPDQGEERDILVRALAAKEGSDIVVIGRDVTERVRLSYEQLDRNLYLSGILENVSDAIITLNAEGVIYSFNRAAEKIFGYSYAEANDFNVTMLIEESSQEAFLAALEVEKGSLKSDTDRPFETIGKRLDGALVHLEFSVGVMRSGERQRKVVALRDVTERKRDLAALRDSRQRYRDITQAASDWFWEIGTDFRISHIGGDFRISPTVSKDLLYGKLFNEVFVRCNTNGARRRKDQQDVFERHLPFRGHLYQLSIDGNESRWFRCSGVPIYGEGGQFDGYRGSLNEATEEINAQNKLKEVQNQLEQALETINDGFVVFDANDRLTLCNSRFRGMLSLDQDMPLEGLTFEELTRLELAHESYALTEDEAEELLQTLLERHRKPVRPYEQELHDGRWILVSDYRTHDGGYVGLRSDISEAKQAELALQHSETLLRTVIDTAPLAITFRDLDGRFVLANKPYTSSRGLDPEEILGKTPAEVLPAKRGETAMDVHQEILDKAETQQFERSLTIGDDVYEEQVISFPIVGDADIPIGVGTIITDVTHSKRLERELNEALKLEAIGQLAGGVAHDFNNILMVIGGYAQRALSTQDDAPRLKASLEEVIKATNKGAAVTKQLLMFSRRQVLEKKVVRVSEVLSELDGLLRPLLGETINLSVDCEDEDACIYADPGLLSQVIMNLAINARDAMQRGGSLRIHSHIFKADEKFASDHPEQECKTFVHISVADQGEGMAPDVLARVFEPFFTTKEQGKGTGLGLPMVYGYIQKSEGTIEVDSKPGDGTKISLFIPLLEQKPTEERVAEDALPIEKDSVTVLVVEDDEALRNLTQFTFEEFGCRVLTASDGIDALDVESDYEDKIDVLVSDVVMPRLTGIELTHAIRETRPDIKTILVSGYPSRGEENDMEIPADVRLLQKPVSRQDFLHNLKEVLDA